MLSASSQNQKTEFETALEGAYSYKSEIISVLMDAYTLFQDYFKKLSPDEIRILEKAQEFLEGAFPNRELPIFLQRSSTNDIPKDSNGQSKLTESQQKLLTGNFYLKFVFPQTHISVSGDKIKTSEFHSYCSDQIRDLVSFFNRYQDKWVKGEYRAIGCLALFAIDVFYALSAMKIEHIETREEIQKYITFFKDIANHIDTRWHQSNNTNPVTEFNQVIDSLEKMFKKARQASAKEFVGNKLAAIKTQLNNIAVHAYEVTGFISDPAYKDNAQKYRELKKSILDYKDIPDEKDSNALSIFMAKLSKSLRDIYQEILKDPDSLYVTSEVMEDLKLSTSGFSKYLNQDPDFNAKFSKFILYMQKIQLLGQYVGYAEAVAKFKGELEFFIEEEPELKALLGYIETSLGKFKSAREDVFKICKEKCDAVREKNELFSGWTEKGKWCDSFLSHLKEFNDAIKFDKFIHHINVIVDEVRALHREYLANRESLIAQNRVVHANFVIGINKYALSEDGVTIRFRDVAELQRVHSINSSVFGDSLDLTERWAPYMKEWFKHSLVDNQEVMQKEDWLAYDQPACIRIQCRSKYNHKTRMFGLELDFKFNPNEYLQEQATIHDDFYKSLPFQDWMQVEIKGPENGNRSDKMNLSLQANSEFSQRCFEGEMNGFKSSMIKKRYYEDSSYSYNSDEPSQSMLVCKWFKSNYLYSAAKSAYREHKYTVVLDYQLTELSGPVQFELSVSQRLLTMLIQSSVNKWFSNTANFKYRFSFNHLTNELNVEHLRKNLETSFYENEVQKNARSSEQFCLNNSRVTRPVARAVPPDAQVPGNAVSPIPGGLRSQFEGRYNPSLFANMGSLSAAQIPIMNASQVPTPAANNGVKAFSGNPHRLTAINQAASVAPAAKKFSKLRRFLFGNSSSKEKTESRQNKMQNRS